MGRYAVSLKTRQMLILAGATLFLLVGGMITQGCDPGSPDPTAPDTTQTGKGFVQQIVDW